MLQQKVNIGSFQKNLPEFLDVVLNGNEIIITKSNIPIAKVTPIEAPKLSVKANFFTMKAIKSKRVQFDEAPENWFG